MGVLTLASASPGRFGPADLELAAEIGRRAALIIDNARLLRETQQAVRLRDEFLSVASHELRTPVTSLRLTVETLLRLADGRRPPSAETLRQSLTRAKHGADRLKRLADELLDVARIDRGPLELTPARVDLRAVARQVIDDLGFELAGARCEVRLDAPAPVVGAWDTSWLEQVLTSLLTNALKFGANRPIDVVVRNAGEVAELAVRDHGVGIEPSRQPFVFDRFVRAVSARHYGGLGLGLYIARRAVRAHGGEIRLESTQGQGATFTVTLPRTVPVQEIPATVGK